VAGWEAFGLLVDKIVDQLQVVTEADLLCDISNIFRYR
jgi:hypothetical protein